MKKIIPILLCFVMILSLCACEVKIDYPSTFFEDNDISIPEDLENIVIPDVNGSSSDNTTTSEPEVSKGTENTNNSSVQTPSSNNSSNNSSQKTSSSSSSSSNVGNSSSNISSSVEKEIEQKLPVVSGGDTSDDTDLVLGVDYGAYLYEGFFVNSVIDKNTVYSIFKTPNSIVVFDTEKLNTVYSKSLPARPAEIQIDGDNLLISFPDLRCINVYNKKTFSQIKSISLPNIVSSFCIDGNKIYYSEDDQHCKVFCTNLATNETTQVAGQRTFYYPKLLLNKEKGLLYIGESGSSGSQLYYCNTSDLSIQSSFAKNNYGLMNNERTMFFVNDNVFWGGFRFASGNATNPIGEYSGNSFYHADKNFAITQKGIFETNTYTFLGEMETLIDFAMVTENKCLVAVFRIHPANIVVAVPY